MAVKIRLKRMGKIRDPHYRIVVADAHTRRDGKTIEQVGRYYPKTDPSLIEVDSDRVQYWLGVGAQPTEPVVAILSRTGDWQRFKGLPAPAEPLGVPARRAEKRERFDEALRRAHADTDVAAAPPRRSRPAGAAEAGESAAPAEPAAESAPAGEPARTAESSPAGSEG